MGCKELKKHICGISLVLFELCYIIAEAILDIHLYRSLWELTAARKSQTYWTGLNTVILQYRNIYLCSIQLMTNRFV
jgi:hypothetical protein